MSGLESGGVVVRRGRRRLSEFDKHLTGSRRVVVWSGVPGDLVDELMHVTGGMVLAAPGRGGVRGGEYDWYRHQLSARDMRVLVGAGLVSVLGTRADELHHQVAEGAYGDRWATAAEFVAWYCETALKGMAQRRTGGDVWADQAAADLAEAEANGWDVYPDPAPRKRSPRKARTVAPAPVDHEYARALATLALVDRIHLAPQVPAHLKAWVTRTAAGDKVTLLADLIAWRYLGAEEPYVPDTKYGRETFVRFAWQTRRLP